MGTFEKDETDFLLAEMLVEQTRIRLRRKALNSSYFDFAFESDEFLAYGCQLSLEDFLRLEDEDSGDDDDDDDDVDDIENEIYNSLERRRRKAMSGCVLGGLESSSSTYDKPFCHESSSSSQQLDYFLDDDECGGSYDHDDSTSAIDPSPHIQEECGVRMESTKGSKKILAWESGVHNNNSSRMSRNKTDTTRQPVNWHTALSHGQPAGGY